MTKNLAKQKHKIVKKSWGKEVWIVNTEDYCGKLLIVGPQWSSKGKFHYHKKKDETFYVIKGVLQLEVMTDGAVSQFDLEKGQSYRVTPQVAHRFKSWFETNCVFIEFSTHHEDSDSYYVEEEN